VNEFKDEISDSSSMLQAKGNVLNPKPRDSTSARSAKAKLEIKSKCVTVEKFNTDQLD
jgi:hypothetical protein